MGVVHVRRVIVVVADRVLPVPALPDTALAIPDSDQRTWFASRQRFRERGLDVAPPGGKIGIAFRQRPQTVHVVGEDNPGTDTEWPTDACRADGFAQRTDVRHQQVGVPVQ
jgi:hypothetical protein